MSEWNNPAKAALMDSLRFIRWIWVLWSSLAFVGAAHDGGIFFLDVASGQTNRFNSDFGLGYLLVLYLRVIGVLFTHVASCFGAILPFALLVFAGQFFLSAETRFRSFCWIVLLYANMQVITMGFFWAEYTSPIKWLGGLSSVPLAIVWLFIAQLARSRYARTQLGAEYQNRREELTERVEALKCESGGAPNYDLTEDWPPDSSNSEH